MNINPISIEKGQNNNILSNAFFQQEDNIQTGQNINFKKLNKNQKNYRHEEIIKNNYHKSIPITQKMTQDGINSLNLTPINNDLLNITYTTPEQNKNKNINSYNNINYNINDYKSLTEDNEKLKELYKNIKENENKIEKIDKTANKILLSKNKNDRINEAHSIIMQMNDLDIDKIQKENITLKADSIIYREDINNLIELNNKYSKDLEILRKKILDLISRNNSIEKNINYKEFQINKLIEIEARLRLYEDPDMDYKIKNSKTKDEILYELEFNTKVCKEENMKLNNEKKALEEKIRDTIHNKNEINKNIIINNEFYDKKINEMEEKIKILEKKINNINDENNLLNINNQRNKNDMIKLINDRNNIENKCAKKNEEYDELLNKYNIINKKYQQLLYDNNRRIIMEKNKIKEKKIIKKSNQEAINEMYNKIQTLKSQVKQERDNEY